MKQSVVVVACLLVLSFLGGCQSTGFPKVMVGVWEAEASKWGKWGFKFEPDGSILKLEHPLAGPVILSEGYVYKEGPDPNTHAIFVMGPCDANYLSRTKELKVEVVLDYFRMKLPIGVLEGRIESYFSGPISRNGKTWAIELREYAWLEGARPPDPNMIDANPNKLVFNKLEFK
ncbi:MAG: hypothetical protein ACYS8I_00730 [Planctomycetota bacterium]|jgi:hypothetical protein